MDLGIDSVEDFNIKYKGGCVVRISCEENNIPPNTLYKIDRLDSDKYLYGYQGSGTSWKPQKLHLSTIEMDPSFPPLGAINYGKAVHIVTRNATKQYRRAFTRKKKVVRFMPVDVATNTVLQTPDLDDSLKATKAIFFPKYYTVEQAIKQIKDNKAWSVAITPRYYIGISVGLPFMYVGYNGYVLGKISTTNGTCSLYKAAIPLIEDLSTIMEVTYND